MTVVDIICSILLNNILKSTSSTVTSLAEAAVSHFPKPFETDEVAF